MLREMEVHGLPWLMVEEEIKRLIEVGMLE